MSKQEVSVSTEETPSADYIKVDQAENGKRDHGSLLLWIVR